MATVCKNLHCQKMSERDIYCHLNFGNCCVTVGLLLITKYYVMLVTLTVVVLCQQVTMTVVVMLVTLTVVLVI